MSRRSVQALVKDLLYESTWRLAKRNADSLVVEEMRDVRASSFPLVSGDTFRSISNVIVEGEGVSRRQQLFENSIVFSDLSEVTGVDEAQEDMRHLSQLLAAMKDNVEKPVVILHNGDFSPGPRSMEEIAAHSSHVFSVNLRSEKRNVTSIPIGAENAFRNRNGKLKNLWDLGHQARPKSNTVFSSFAVRNNPTERNQVAEALRSSRFPSNARRLTPEQHVSMVRQSMFVLSPPGRGYDCHRTWEAIYLGAIPVVAAGSLAPGLVEGLPIVEVSSYDAFLSKTDEELVTLFTETISRSSEKAFMPYWLGKIVEATRAKK